jgi:N-acetylmuramoyl-L-alanine amidase
MSNERQEVLEWLESYLLLSVARYRFLTLSQMGLRSLIESQEMNRSLVNMLCVAVVFGIVTAAALADETVCIDPGHPSETSSGAQVGKLREMTINWQVAVKVRDILTADHVTVVMTKSSEKEFITNAARAEIANNAHAAAFIRLHCDDGSGSGFTWYYPDHAGHKNGVTGPPPAVCRESRDLATALNKTMAESLRGELASNPVKTDASTFVGRRQGGVLTGSIYARVPTALIEMCYLNQPKDAAFIASPQGQNAMAHAIASAIEAYLASRHVGN